MKPIAPNERMASWLEQAWLNRYLDRKLEDDEAEWFEMYVLDRPELIAAIEADNDLRDGMTAVGSAKADSKVTPIGRASARPTRRAVPLLAWAASAVAGVGLGWILAQQFTAGTTAAPEIVASPTRIVFDTLRGVEDAPQVYPGLPDSEWVLVEVGLPADAEDVVLLRDGFAEIPLTVSREGFASALLSRTIARNARFYIKFRSANKSHLRSFELDDHARGKSSD